MKLRWLLLLLVVLPANRGDAQEWLGTGYAAACPGWWPGARVYTQEHIPYYAKHPPVYYSRPVARSYGSLPYAYLPEVPAPRVVVASPLVVQNHLVAGQANEGLSAGQSPRPMRIVNPFAQEAERPLSIPDPSPLSDPGTR